MAFFSPGFMLGAAQRATEIIDDTRERNEDLAEEIKDLTKEHGKIASKAISVRAAEDSEFISIAKQTLLSSNEGKAILKNVENSQQTLVAIGREASKRIKGNLTPKLFNKSLLSKSTTPDGKFQNPYTLSNADLTKNPSEEAKQTEKLGFGQKVLQNLVGKKPTIEEATAGMTPEMREATLQSIRTGQPLATRDPVEFGAGQIETPVLSEAEEERMRLADQKYEERYTRRLADQDKRTEENRKLAAELRGEKRELFLNTTIPRLDYQDRLTTSRMAETIEIQQKRQGLNPQQQKERGLDDESMTNRLNELASISGQLRDANYYKNRNVTIDGEAIFDAPLRILDETGETRLSRSDLTYLTENGIDTFIRWIKGGRKEEGVGGSIDLSAASSDDQSQKQTSENSGAQSTDEIRRGSVTQGINTFKDTGDAGALAAAKRAADIEAAKTKQEQDKELRSTFPLFKRSIELAAKNGLNPENNPDLKEAIQIAKGAGVPQNIILEALERAAATASAEPTPQTAAGSLSRFQAQQDLRRKAREAGVKLPSQAKKPKPLAQDEKKPKVKPGSILYGNKS
jgi:hypothetical protein